MYQNTFLVDCTWSEWTIGECDCDRQVKPRTRTKNVEENGGKECEGKAYGSTLLCDPKECPPRKVTFPYLLNCHFTKKQVIIEIF